MRGMCVQALRETTRMEFGFEPQGDEQAREKAIEGWRTWSEARSRDINQQG